MQPPVARHEGVEDVVGQDPAQRLAVVVHHERRRSAGTPPVRWRHRRGRCRGGGSLGGSRDRSGRRAGVSPPLTSRSNAETSPITRPPSSSTATESISVPVPGLLGQPLADLRDRLVGVGTGQHAGHDPARFVPRDAQQPDQFPPGRQRDPGQQQRLLVPGQFAQCVNRLVGFHSRQQLGGLGEAPPRAAAR